MDGRGVDRSSLIWLKIWLDEKLLTKDELEERNSGLRLSHEDVWWIEKKWAR